MRVPGAFASLLAQERDTPSCLATVAILMPGEYGSRLSFEHRDRVQNGTARGGRRDKRSAAPGGSA